MSCWSIFDIMTVSPKIYVEGKSRFYTTFGLILTFIILAIIYGSSIYFLVDFLGGKNMNIINLKDRTNLAALADFNGKILMFSVGDIDGSAIDPRLVRIVPVLRTTLKNQPPVMQELQIETCQIDRHINDTTSKQIIDFDVSSYFCIKPGQANISIYQSTQDFDSAYMSIYISECVNSTENNNFCYSKEEISSELKKMNMYLYFATETSTFNHYNLSSPVDRTYFWTADKLGYEFFTIYSKVYTKLKYISDDGVFSEKPHEYNTFFYDDAKSSQRIYPQGTVSYIPSSFAVFILVMNGEYVDSYKRSFAKLQTVVGNIGGVMNALMSAGQFISELVTRGMLNVHLANYILSFKKPNTSQNKMVSLSNITPENTVRSKTPQNSFIRTNLANTALRPDKKLENKNPRRRPQREITWLEAILPKKCFDSYSIKQVADKCDMIIKNKLSSEGFLQLHHELLNLKEILFKSKQLELFNLIPYRHIEEIYKEVEKENAESFEDIQNLLKNIVMNEKNEATFSDEIDKRILKVYDGQMEKS